MAGLFGLCGEGVHTVICSRRKSRSSSQFDSDVFAVLSFPTSSSSASSMGYESITLACTRQQTSPHAQTTLWIIALVNEAVPLAR